MSRHRNLQIKHFGKRGAFSVGACAIFLVLKTDEDDFAFRMVDPRRGKWRLLWPTLVPAPGDILPPPRECGRQGAVAFHSCPSARGAWPRRSCRHTPVWRTPVRVLVCTRALPRVQGRAGCGSSSVAWEIGELGAVPSAVPAPKGFLRLLLHALEQVQVPGCCAPVPGPHPAARGHGPLACPHSCWWPPPRDHRARTLLRVNAWNCFPAERSRRHGARGAQNRRHWSLSVPGPRGRRARPRRQDVTALAQDIAPSLKYALEGTERGSGTPAPAVGGRQAGVQSWPLPPTWSWDVWGLGSRTGRRGRWRALWLFQSRLTGGTWSVSPGLTWEAARGTRCSEGPPASPQDGSKHGGSEA